MNKNKSSMTLEDIRVILRNVQAEPNVTRCYISGAITSDPEFKAKFQAAQEKLEKFGFRVFNPTCLPPIFTWPEFMDIDLTCLRNCDAIYMLPDWETSRGAKIEHAFAVSMNLPVIYEAEGLI